MNINRLLAAVIAATFLLFVQGCGAPEPITAAAEASPERLVWPPPPAQPRVRYLRSVSGPRDLGIAKPFFRRLLDALGGAGADRFVRPTGVAARSGALYVADPGAQALWILDSAQGRYVKVTSVGAASLVAPVAVALAPDGAIFLADTGLKKVFLLDGDGRLMSTAAQEGLERPAGLAYDAASKWLYVADSANNRISVFGPQGQLVRTWGRGGDQSGEFNHPTYIALDAAGTLRVTDALGFRIQSFDRNGRFLGTFGRPGDGSGDFASPKGVATDSQGHVYVVDALFDAVQIFEPNGTYLLGFGERGTQAGQFWLPGGIFIDSKDHIYVADAYNQRIQMFLAAPVAAKEPKP